MGHTAFLRCGRTRIRWGAELPRPTGFPPGGPGRPSALGQGLERGVQLQDVDAGLAHEAEGAAGGVVLDELLDLLDVEAVLLRDPGDLDLRVLRGDVRVEAGAGGGDGVGRHVRGPDLVRRRGVVRDHGVLGVGDQLDQIRVVAGLVGGAGEDQGVLLVDAVGAEAIGGARLEPLQVRPGGLLGVVGVLLGQVVGLADEGRSDDLPVLVLDLGTVGLVAERDLGDAGDGERVDDPAQDRQDQQGAQARADEPCGVADRVVHGGYQPIPGMRVMSRSMILMPMNGAIRPPSP